MRTPILDRMPPSPERPTVNYLQAALIGIWLAFAMAGGSFLGVLLYDAFDRYQIKRTAARKDLSQ
jgi:hypothetical protein